LVKGYPKYNSVLGVENKSSSINAAVWWKRNHKTYLLSKQEYWRMDMDEVEDGYPKSNDVWKGIPKNIDTAFSSRINDDFNYTYFVKGDDYYTFHNLKVKVTSYTPKSFKADWLRCFDKDKTKPEVATEKPASSPLPPKLIAIICVSVVALVLIISGISCVMWHRQRRYKKGSAVYRSEAGTSVQVFDDGGESTMCVSFQRRFRLFRSNFQGKV